MSSVITGQYGLYIYWMRNAAWKSGSVSGDTHQAINPITESTGLKLPEPIYDLIRTCNSLYPTIEVDKNLEPSTITFRTYYRDPFMLLTVFSYKGVPGTWTGTEDTISANFTTSTANIDNNIAIQIHLHDTSGNNKHIDLFLDGGKITRYSLTAEAGEALIEEFDIKFAEITVDTPYNVDIADGFDDGSFNQTGVKEVNTITAKAAASITNNTYFFIYAADGDGSETKYHVWFNKDAGGVDPAPSGSTAIEVAVTTGQAAGVIATAIGAALDGASTSFGTPVVADPLVTVTQANNGDISDIVDYNSGLTLATTTQGKNDLDGGWSYWDGEICTSTEKVVLASDCVIQVGGAAPTGLRVKSITLEIDVPKAMEFVQSSQIAGITWEEGRGPWKCSIGGKLSGNHNIAETVAHISSKTKSTVKFSYNTGLDKYLQFTNALLKSIDGLEIPKAGEPIDVTYQYEGGASSALTFSWTGTETTDPSDMINHTNT